MTLPLRQHKAQTKKIRPRTKPRRTKAVKCRPHINWVLACFQCVLVGKHRRTTGLPHKCEGPTDPHHTPTRGAGGGDDNVVPLCRKAHRLLDSPNWSEKRLEAEYNVDLRATALSLWEASPPGKRYRVQEQRAIRPSLQTASHPEQGEGVLREEGK